MNFFDFCECGNIEGVKRLLDEGEDINQINFSGKTGLYLACKRGHYEIVIELLNRGADIDRGKINMDRYFDDSRTPVMESCIYYKCTLSGPLIFRELIKRGANVEGITPEFLKYETFQTSIREEIMKFIEENGNISSVKPALSHN